jgi:hypothetical protein
MEFFLNDPNIEKLPPEETRLLDLRAEPDAAGKRIRVALELTPFQKRPYIELNLADTAGRIVTTVSIIEPVAWKLELTLHVRTPAAATPSNQGSAASSCTLTAILSYPDLGEIHRLQIPVDCMLE